MTERSSSQKPGGRRRLAAIGGLALVVLVFVWTVIAVLDDPLGVVLQVVLLVVALMAFWMALTRTGVGRWAGVVVAAAAVVAALALQVSGEGASLLSLLASPRAARGRDPPCALRAGSRRALAQAERDAGQARAGRPSRAC